MRHSGVRGKEHVAQTDRLKTRVCCPCTRNLARESALVPDSGCRDLLQDVHDGSFANPPGDVQRAANGLSNNMMWSPVTEQVAWARGLRRSAAA